MNRSSSMILAGLVGLVIVGGYSLSASAADDHEPHQQAPRPTALAERLNLSPTTPSEQATAAHEAEMRRIGKDVVCLCGTCPKRFIADCDCGWAEMIRTTLLNAVVAGKTHDELVHTYQEVYGGRGLALPPDDDLLAKVAWALPYAGAVFGLFFAFLFGVRLMRRSEDKEEPPEKPAASGAGEEAREELQRALEDMD